MKFINHTKIKTIRKRKNTNIFNSHTKSHKGALYIIIREVSAFTRNNVSGEITHCRPPGNIVNSTSSVGQVLRNIVNSISSVGQVPRNIVNSISTVGQVPGNIVSGISTIYLPGHNNKAMPLMKILYYRRIVS